MAALVVVEAVTGETLVPAIAGAVVVVAVVVAVAVEIRVIAIEHIAEREHSMINQN